MHALTPQEWLAFANFAAALAGAVINMLFELRIGSTPIDIVLVGALSLFAGTVMAPVLIAPLAGVLPGLGDVGQVPVAGAVALFGAHFLLRQLERLHGEDEEAD